MQLSNISLEDGRAMATIMKLLASGRWDLSGKDTEHFVVAHRWIAEIAKAMAAQLQSSPKSAAAPDPASQAGAASQSIKIKAMGPLGSSPSKRRKSK